MNNAVMIALALLAQTARAQDGPNAREQVFILADSLKWVLSYHTFPGSRATACEVATRKQPGAIFRRFWENQRTFTVHLMESAAPPDSFVLQIDGKLPVVRRATDEERSQNVLHLRGSQGPILVDAAASRLRIQAFYPARERQDLEIDLTGFIPLYWRAMQFDCLPFKHSLTTAPFRHLPHGEAIKPRRPPPGN